MGSPRERDYAAGKPAMKWLLSIWKRRSILSGSLLWKRSKKKPQPVRRGAGVFRGAPFHARNGEQVRTDHGGHKLLEPKNIVAVR
jgi:hypothetical protein